MKLLLIAALLFAVSCTPDPVMPNNNLVTIDFTAVPGRTWQLNFHNGESSDPTEVYSFNGDYQLIPMEPGDDYYIQFFNPNNDTFYCAQMPQFLIHTTGWYAERETLQSSYVFTDGSELGN